MADQLTERYGDLLQGSYDCVDRIVLNAYNSLCYSGWWLPSMAATPEEWLG